MNVQLVLKAASLIQRFEEAAKNLRDAVEESLECNDESILELAVQMASVGAVPAASRMAPASVDPIRAAPSIAQIQAAADAIHARPESITMQMQVRHPAFQPAADPVADPVVDEAARKFSDRATGEEGYPADVFEIGGKFNQAPLPAAGLIQKSVSGNVYDPSGQRSNLVSYSNPRGDVLAARLTRVTGALHYVDVKDGHVKMMGALPGEALAAAAGPIEKYDEKEALAKPFSEALITEGEKPA